MTLLFEFIILGFATFAIGMGGLASSRNFIIMMLSAEVAIAASTIVALSFYYFVASSDILLFMVVIWSIASAEIMVLVAFYRYMVKQEISVDVRKLSKLKN